MINVGTDLLLLDGEIVFEGDNLATVSGEENLKQQAYLRFLTDLGESLYFPTYGTRLHEFIAKPFTPENAKKAEEEAKSVLLQVGNTNGQGWIEKVIDCQLTLADVGGKSVKVLHAKFLVRGEEEPRDLELILGGDLP